MPSIAGSDTAPGALPTFQADAQQATRVREFQGTTGQEAASVFGALSKQLGAWMDRAAEDVGKQQGQKAGLDPNYRPDQDESEMGIARRNAAVATYGNNLEATARNSLGDAYQQFSQLPPDQRTPARLQATFATIKQDFDKNHVFDQVAGPFNASFSSMSGAYMRQAQSDLDARQQDAAKASFLTNQNSARDAALKVANLSTADPAHLSDLVRQHDATVDAQVKNGTLTAVQAVGVKDGFRQDVMSQYAWTQFQNTPDAQKAAFLASFRQKFLGSAASETEQQLADRIHSLQPTLSNEQCVELARKGAGIPEGVRSWRKGDSATAARLPIGTPVATFLNRDGSPSNLYDGGEGVGAPGNNTTHAGIVAGYDAEGNLKLWEQYAGSGGPHIQVYKPGDSRGGEKDANNYFSINGDDGKPLGSANPLAARATPAPQAAGLNVDTALKLENQMTSALRGMTSQAEHAQKAAIGDIDADVKQMEAGYAVPADEWAAKRAHYENSVDPIVANEWHIADRINTLYSGFKGQSPEQVEAAVATMRSAVSDGATPAQARILEAAQKYATRLRADFDKDPLSRAAVDGVISGVTPLDFSSPATTARTLQARVAARDQVAQHYGRPVPLVTPDDRETVKAVAAAGGEPMVQTARAVVAALGPRAGEFFSQIGGDAPQFAQMGRINDASVMRDAAWAIAQDHAKEGKVMRPAPEALQQTVATTYGDAFKAIPDFAQGAKHLASSALAATIAREGLDPKTPYPILQQETLQKAAGATYVGGVQYGGVANYGGWWNGSQKVLAPENVRADQVKAVVGAITDKDLAALPAPPRAADGSPMPASALSGLRFTSVGPGVYMLSKGDPFGEDPQWVAYQGGGRGASGRFKLDLNALEPQLRARVPGAYK